MTETQVKPRWTAIELDETCYLEGDSRVKKFSTVYIFDRNFVTRICSPVLHYWLIPIYQNVEFAEGTEDDVQERVLDELGAELGDPGYYTEKDIERLIADGKARIADFGELEKGEGEDEVREAWRSNQPL